MGQGGKRAMLAWCLQPAMLPWAPARAVGMECRAHAPTGAEGTACMGQAGARRRCGLVLGAPAAPLGALLASRRAGPSSLPSTHPSAPQPRSAQSAPEPQGLWKAAGPPRLRCRPGGWAARFKTSQADKPARLVAPIAAMRRRPTWVCVGVWRWVCRMHSAVQDACRCGGTQLACRQPG